MAALIYGTVQLGQQRNKAARTDGTAYIVLSVWYLSGEGSRDLVFDKEIVTECIQHSACTWPRGYMLGLKHLLEAVEEIDYRGLTVEIPYENASKWFTKKYGWSSDIGEYFSGLSNREGLKVIKPKEATELGIRCRKSAEAMLESKGLHLKDKVKGCRAPSESWVSMGSTGDEINELEDGSDSDCTLWASLNKRH